MELLLVVARRAIRGMLARLGRPAGPPVFRATFKVVAARPVLDDERGKT